MSTEPINKDVIKPLARRLKKEWQAMGMKKVAASGQEHGISLKSRFSTEDGKMVVITALLTPGVINNNNASLMVDVVLPEGPRLEPCLTALSAFMQQATAQFSPVSVLADVKNNRVVLRQSQLTAVDYPVSLAPFLNSARALVPLLRDALVRLCARNPSPDKARQMADELSSRFYGAIAE
ncbi:MAG: hypothetical protein OXC07_10470 [Kistimonas sp.]|nr:hypothetical protein [Kistimonas sp.]